MSETERLIESVRATPILYDTSHADYKNTVKKEEAWFRIIESFEQNGKNKNYLLFI